MVGNLPRCGLGGNAHPQPQHDFSWSSSSSSDDDEDEDDEDDDDDGDEGCAGRAAEDDDTTPTSADIFANQHANQKQTTNNFQMQR